MKKVEITLDKVRHLAFPMMSLIKLKKEFGIQLTDLQDEKKAQDMEVITAIIWAGLIHEDRELSFEDVAYMIDVSMLPEVSAKLSEIFAGMSQKNLQE
ncbi:hypothetical protein V7128_07300 [Neobacillus vireti]|uniref:hypothetical protein n=1 Tax=Neobacillus vireti TaxID=220686 RepID=UPI0030009948